LTAKQDRRSRVHHDDIIYPSAIPFALVHLACFGILWTGVTASSLALCLGLYVVRMFAVTAGYHRYFSHRSYRTSRVGQFVLAFLCQTSAQKGVLWWAAQHRHHHRYSDTPEDLHSPGQHGFLFAHFGWIFAKQRGEADYSLVPDLTKYPELVWLNKHQYVPPAVLAVAVWLAAGWTGLFVGFFLSTVLLYHGTFAINSLAHVVGTQRYVTGDDSRNNWWLALITLGEGWHNNHHHYQSSTRQGFRWYEIDPTYYLLKVLSWTGLVWDLREPPEAVVRGEQRLGRRALEKVARQVAESYPIARVCERIRDAWTHSPGLEGLYARARQAGLDLEAAFAELHLPQSRPFEALRVIAAKAGADVKAVLAALHLPELPAVDELRQRAREMFAHTPSLDEIAERAHELVVEAVSGKLFGEPAAEGAA